MGRWCFWPLKLGRIATGILLPQRSTYLAHFKSQLTKFVAFKPSEVRAGCEDESVRLFLVDQACLIRQYALPTASRKCGTRIAAQVVPAGREAIVRSRQAIELGVW